MKLVHTAFDVPNAHMIRQLLEDHGIAAVVEGEQLYALRGEMPTVYPTVWVSNDADLQRAREIIEEFSSRAPAVSRDTWTCPVCHEEIENQFSECWRCSEVSEGAAVVDPATRKLKTALATTLFLGLGCGFLSFFVSHLSQVSVQTVESQRQLAHVAALTRLACVLFGIMAVYFIARLANTGKRA